MIIRRIEKFQKRIENFNFPIVVEGKRDKEALFKMGFSSIIDISGKSLENTIKSVVAKHPDSIAILTDFDKEGERQFRVLMKIFNSQRIKIDNSLRKEVKSTFGIQKIEELNYFAEMMSVGRLPNCNKMLNRKKFFKRAERQEARFHE